MTFHLTFGCQYAVEPHPAGSLVHPDGWWEIDAPDYSAARSIAVALLGARWAFLYTPDEWVDSTAECFPRGCLLRIEARNVDLPVDAARL